MGAAEGGSHETEIEIGFSTFAILLPCDRLSTVVSQLGELLITLPPKLGHKVAARADSSWRKVCHVFDEWTKKGNWAKIGETGNRKRRAEERKPVGVRPDVVEARRKLSVRVWLFDGLY